jgi:hypothetical protein
MSDFFGLDTELSLDLTGIQPVTEDFSTDGQLDQFARIDHQHPLSESLRAAIFSSTLYIKKSGDTMTGQLNLTTSHIALNFGYAVYFNYPTSTELIYAISAPGGMPWHTGIRIQAIDGWSFYNTAVAADVMGYRGVAGTGYLWVGNRTLLGQTPNDASSVYTLNMNGHIGMLASSAIIWTNWYNAACIWMQDATWVRVQPNFYTGGICGGNSGISAGGGAGGMGGYSGIYCPGTAGFSTTLYVAGTITGAGAINGYQITGSSQGGAWQNSAIRSIPATATASLCLHNGSYAPVIGSTLGTGNNMYFRDGAFNGASAACFAASWNSDSSVRFKKNINDWPLKAVGASVENVIDLVAKLRTVTFQHKLPLLDTGGSRRSLALVRLNAFKDSKGLERYNYEMPEHDCAIHECDGTDENPCIPKVMADRERIGFIAEEVYEIFPNAVPLDASNKPEAIDLGQMLAISFAAIQELTNRIKVLEGAA